MKTLHTMTSNLHQDFNCIFIIWMLLYWISHTGEWFIKI